MFVYMRWDKHSRIGYMMAAGESQMMLAVERERRANPTHGMKASSRMMDTLRSSHDNLQSAPPLVKWLAEDNARRAKLFKVTKKDIVVRAIH